jgi:hypothetical protein
MWSEGMDSWFVGKIASVMKWWIFQQAMIDYGGVLHVIPIPEDTGC